MKPRKRPSQNLEDDGFSEKQTDTIKSLDLQLPKKEISHSEPVSNSSVSKPSKREDSKWLKEKLSALQSEQSLLQQKLEKAKNSQIPAGQVLLDIIFIPKHESVENKDDFRGMLTVTVLACKELPQVNNKFPNPLVLITFANTTMRTKAQKKTSASISPLIFFVFLEHILLFNSLQEPTYSDKFHLFVLFNS